MIDLPTETAPLVSIIIPAYNASQTIEDAIYSILNQSYRNLEILVVDDGSQDNTFKVINSIVDNRLRIFSNSENLGYLATVNNAIELCAGEYIGFQDADDTSDLKRIESQIIALRNSPQATIALTQCFYDEVCKPGNGYFSNFPSTKHAAVESLRSGETRIFCGASLLANRATFSKVGKFRLVFDRIGAEHVDWFFRALRTEEFVMIDEPLYNYRIQLESFSRTFSGNPLKFHSLQLALLSFLVFREDGLDPLSEESLTDFIISSIIEPYTLDPGRIDFAIGLNHVRNENAQATLDTVLRLFSSGRRYFSLKLLLTAVFYFIFLKRLPEQFTRHIVKRRNLFFVKKIRALILEKVGNCS